MSQLRFPGPPLNLEAPLLANQVSGKTAVAIAIFALVLLSGHAARRSS
jgi:hypothetical protein